LSEVCLKTKNIKWSENAGREFEYIDLSSVCRENNNISETQTINAENAPSRAQQIVQLNDVIFATTRPTLKRYSYIDTQHDGQICSTGFCVLRADTKQILPKYLFYLITASDFGNYVEQNQEGTSYPAISDAKVKNYGFALPTLDEQKRIVALLDKFATLTTNLTQGLPAEIEARQKQYEYYRDKLLTFKEKKSA
jgi:type I restriction enzyme S subunit